MFKKYFAEFIGTFTLSYIVLASLAYQGTLPIEVPLIAGLTVAMFVYTIGAISGAHLNPSVTIGLYSIKKISLYDTLYYYIFQTAGAVVAILVAKEFGMASPLKIVDGNLTIFAAEMMGAFILNFAIASVVFDKVSDMASGLVIGGSLTVGIIIASLSGSAGILNPAVALALGASSLLYLLAPIAGSIAAYHVYKRLQA